MKKLDLMIEAERRGILPPEKQALLNEARSRGLVSGGTSSRQPRTNFNPPEGYHANQAAREEIKEGSPFLAGMGYGMKSINDGVHQLLARGANAAGVLPGGDQYISELDKDVTEDRRLYDALSDHSGSAMAGNITGQAVATAPVLGIGGAAVNPYAKGAALAAQGATVGLLQPVTGENDNAGFLGEKAFTTAVGAGVGIVAPPLVKTLLKAGGEGAVLAAGWVGKALKKLRGSNISEQEIITGAQQSGIPWGEMNEAARQSFMGEVKNAIKYGTAEQDSAFMKRMDDFETVGMKGEAGPTAGQATQDFGRISRESELAKLESNIGAPLRERRGSGDRIGGNQGAALLGRSQGMAESLGGRASTEYQAGATYQSAVKGAAKRNRQATNQLYTKSREMEDWGAEIPNKFEFLKDADIFMRDFEGVLPQEIQRRLSRFFPEPEGSTGRMLEPERPVNLQELDEIGKLANTYFDPTNRSLQRALGQLKTRLIKPHTRQFKEYSKAQRAAARYLGEERIPQVKGVVSKKDQYAGTATEDIADKFFVKGKVAPLKATKRYLQRQGAPGKQAWDEMRTQVYKKGMEKSFDSTAQGVLFSPQKFIKYWEGMGIDKMKALFNEKERLFIRTQMRVAKTLVTPQAAANRSNTTAKWFDHMMRLTTNKVWGLRALNDAAKNFADADQVARSLDAEGTVKTEMSEASQAALQRAIDTLMKRTPIGSAPHVAGQKALRKARYN